VWEMKPQNRVISGRLRPLDVGGLRRENRKNGVDAGFFRRGGPQMSRINWLVDDECARARRLELKGVNRG